MKAFEKSIAVALSGLLCISVAQAEPPQAPEAPVSIVVSSAGSVAIAGLSAASISALPAFPANAYREATGKVECC